jgi:hypothetical protein
MPTATPSSASASAWSGLSIVDNTASQLRHRVVLNNSLAADHTVAGLDNNQQLGDTIDLVNRGTKNLTLNAEDTTAAAKDRFTSAVFVPAGGKVRLYYNGTRWEAFSDTPGAIITKMVQFAETATGLTHTGTVPIPAGAILLGIDVIPQVLWGGGTVAMNVGDSASGTGYFSGINLKATDALVGEVFDTNASELWGGKQGAYLVAATGQRGPTASNFGKLYVAGSNIVGVITVTTPAVNTGRTTMVVRYCIPQAIAPVVV